MRVLLACLLIFGAVQSGMAARYKMTYTVQIQAQSKTADVRWKLESGSGKARELAVRLPASRFSEIRADGTFSHIGDRYLWLPPAAGGTLRYQVKLDYPRRDRSFRGLITPTWAIFRGDHIFPAANVKAQGSSKSSLVWQLPKGWTVETPYNRDSRNHMRFEVKDAERRFDRPVGWMAIGNLGTRREDISGIDISATAPVGQGMRRQDMLAFLNYTLPEMRRAFATPRDKILIVSGPDPLFRGGLSAPGSLFIHLDRPMISENGTSPVLHELTHTMTRIRGEARADWIAEGLAEFYGIEILRRTGGLSEQRYEQVRDWLKSWSSKVKHLKVPRSRGETTARAVVLLQDLDTEIRNAKGVPRNLDDVTRRLVKLRKISNVEFLTAVEEVLGRPSKVLQTPLLAN